MAFAAQCSMELVSPTHRAGCLQTRSPMAAYVYCLLNITDHPCLSILCMRQTGCCHGERVCSWTSSQRRLLAIRRSTRRPGSNLRPIDQEKLFRPILFSLQNNCLHFSASKVIQAEKMIAG